MEESGTNITGEVTSLDLACEVRGSVAVFLMEDTHVAGVALTEGAMMDGVVSRTEDGSGGPRPSVPLPSRGEGPKGDCGPFGVSWTTAFSLDCESVGAVPGDRRWR